MLKYTSIVVLVVCSLLASCKKDNDEAPSPVLALSAESATGKSGKTIETTLSITAPSGLKELKIKKTIDLKVDDKYGTGGVLTVVPTSSGTNTWEYHFTYTLKAEEVDKLVGFNFHFEDNKGKTGEKDFTVNTAASGSLIIASHTWKLTSKFWKTGSPAAEDIKDCEKDDTFKWNANGTIVAGYGSSACSLDGLNVYDHWSLSEDEKTFTQVYHALFTPTNITTEVYNVTTLTKEKLVMEITVDLSWLGAPYTDHEKFAYTYVAQ